MKKLYNEFAFRDENDSLYENTGIYFMPVTVYTYMDSLTPLPHRKRPISYTIKGLPTQLNNTTHIPIIKIPLKDIGLYHQVLIRRTFTDLTDKYKE